MDFSDFVALLVLVAFWFAAAYFGRGLARLEQAVRRLERAAAVVAVNLAQSTLEETVDRMEAATKVVAADLASSIQRADDAEGPDGSAADAALRSAPDPDEN